MNDLRARGIAACDDLQAAQIGQTASTTSIAGFHAGACLTRTFVPPNEEITSPIMTILPRPNSMRPAVAKANGAIPDIVLLQRRYDSIGFASPPPRAVLSVTLRWIRMLSHVNVVTRVRWKRGCDPCQQLRDDCPNQYTTRGLSCLLGYSGQTCTEAKGD